MAKYGEPSPIPEPIKGGKIAKLNPKIILVVIPILVCFLYAINSQNIDSRQQPRPATSGNQAEADLIAISCSLKGSTQTFRIGESEKPVSRQDFFIVNSKQQKLYNQKYELVSSEFWEDSIFPYGTKPESNVNPLNGKGFTSRTTYKINRKTLEVEYISINEQNVTDLGEISTATRMTGACAKVPLPVRPKTIKYQI